MITDIKTFIVNVRPTREEDLEQIQVIDQHSFNLPWPARAFRHELLENPHARLWTAEANSGEGAVVVGVIVVWLIIDEVHIATIAVQPEFRRRGIGRRLLAAALQDALRSGCRNATLEVRAGNQAAQSLYRRFGFEVVGWRPRYYRDNQEDAILMTAANLGEAYSRWLENGGWEREGWTYS